MACHSARVRFTTDSPASLLSADAHVLPAPRTTTLRRLVAQCKDGRDVARGEGQHTVEQCNSRYSGCVGRAGAKDADKAEAIAQLPDERLKAALPRHGPGFADATARHNVAQHAAQPMASQAAQALDALHEDFMSRTV